MLDPNDLRSVMAAEGNGEDFFSSWLPCSVLRGTLGVWCGYVGVDKRHPLHGVEYGEGFCPVVHGGLTFYGLRKNRGPLWWFGFDCGHLGDIIPEFVFSGNLRTYGYESLYRTKSYAIDQTRNLAKQIEEHAELMNNA